MDRYTAIIGVCIYVGGVTFPWFAYNILRRDYSHKAKTINISIILLGFLMALGGVYSLIGE